MPLYNQLTPIHEPTSQVQCHKWMTSATENQSRNQRQKNTKSDTLPFTDEFTTQQKQILTTNKKTSTTKRKTKKSQKK